jgi:HAD superfamily hydrolase (TIGR01509 family)
MLNKETVRAVLFDMDGTLTDTEPLGIEALRVTLDEFDVHINEDEWSLFDQVWRRDGTDVSAEEFIYQILQNYRPTADVAEFTKTFYERYEQAIVQADILPGASELLHHLKGKYKLALVTASKQSQAQSILKQHGWQEAFDVVVSQDEFIIKKPDPASFLMAADKLGISPEHCVVVEDSKNGCKAGKSSGAYVFGVRAGNKHSQDLSAADEIVDTLNDIVEKL